MTDLFGHLGCSLGRRGPSDGPAMMSISDIDLSVRPPLNQLSLLVVQTRQQQIGFDHWVVLSSSTSVKLSLPRRQCIHSRKVQPYALLSESIAQAPGTNFRYNCKPTQASDDFMDIESRGLAGSSLSMAALGRGALARGATKSTQCP
jgi:hypothetical protein